MVRFQIHPRLESSAKQWPFTVAEYTVLSLSKRCQVHFFQGSKKKCSFMYFKFTFLPDRFEYRISLWFAVLPQTPPSHHLVQVEPLSENILFYFSQMTLQPCKAKGTIFLSTEYRGNLHATLQNTLGSTHRKHPSIYCDVLTRHPHLHHTPPCSHLDLSSPRYPISCCSWAPTASLCSPLLLLFPPWAQWVVWRQVFVVGCLRQVQTISVFVNVDVWFSNLCLWSGF